MGSTGGVARAMFKHLLENGNVDAVYSLHKNSSEPLREAHGRYYIGKVPFESVPQSLYRPIPWGEGIAGIQKQWQSILLIGVPCQIKGASKYLKDNYPEIQIWAIALICRQQKNTFYTDYVKKLLGAEEVEVERVTYRGEGWPGKLGITGKKMEKPPSFLASGEAFGNNLWRVPGCKYCGDCLGGKIADITLADPWNYISETEDPEGTNIGIVWTEKGKKMLLSCSSCLSVSAVEHETVENILMFDVIERKKKEIAIRMGRTSHFIEKIRFSLGEKKIGLLEDLLLHQEHDSLKLRVICWILKNLRWV